MCTFTCVIELVEVVAYGRAASEALAAGVTSAKAAGPLVPVTVIVPSNFVGLSARRLLGSGALEHGGKGGVANVSFVTPFRLAEMTAADLLLEQQPITNPVLGAAVRQVLANDPDVYRPVAQHEATEAALAALDFSEEALDLADLAEGGADGCSMNVTDQDDMPQMFWDPPDAEDCAPVDAADLEADEPCGPSVDLRDGFY